MADGVIRKGGEIAGSAILGEENFAGNPRLKREQPHNRQGCDGFAGAGFAHQAEDFTGSD
jgi:hypothetical protein